MTLSDTTNRNNAINSLCYVIPLWIALAFQVLYLHHCMIIADDWNKTINERTPTIESWYTFKINVVCHLWALITRIYAYSLQREQNGEVRAAVFVQQNTYLVLISILERINIYILNCCVLRCLF